MPRKHKLSREEISRILSKGRRFHGVYATIAYMPGHGPKYTVVVAKSVVALSSSRNTIKRRFRDILRKSGLVGSLVLTAKKTVKGVGYAEVLQDLTKILAQIQR